MSIFSSIFAGPKRVWCSHEHDIRATGLQRSHHQAVIDLYYPNPARPQDMLPSVAGQVDATYKDLAALPAGCRVLRFNWMLGYQSGSMGYVPDWAAIAKTRTLDTAYTAQAVEMIASRVRASRLQLDMVFTDNENKLDPSINNGDQVIADSIALVAGPSKWTGRQPWLFGQRVQPRVGNFLYCMRRDINGLSKLRGYYGDNSYSEASVDFLTSIFNTYLAWDPASEAAYTKNPIWNEFINCINNLRACSWAGDCVPWLGAPWQEPQWIRSPQEVYVARFLQAEFVQHAVRMGVDLFGCANYLFSDPTRILDETSIDKAILSAEPHYMDRKRALALHRPGHVQYDAQQVRTGDYVTDYQAVLQLLDPIINP